MILSQSPPLDGTSCRPVSGQLAGMLSAESAEEGGGWHGEAIKLPLMTVQGVCRQLPPLTIAITGV